MCVEHRGRGGQSHSTGASPLSPCAALHRLVSIVHSKNLNPRAGFSAIGVVVALATLTLLTAVGLPLGSQRLDQVKVEQASADCAAMVSAICLFKLEHGHYPGGIQSDPTYNYQGPDEGGLRVLSAELQAGSDRFGDLELGLDPWGQPYCYHIYTRSDPYQDVIVYSTGPDRTSQSWDGTVWNSGRFAGDDIGRMHDE